MFPVPQICEFLTPESRQKVYYTTDRDEQGSKVSDFFVRSDELYNEMKWQRKLRSQRALYFVSSHMSSWASISFNLQFFLNLIVALFYPFEKANLPMPDLLLSLILYLLVIASFITLYKFRNRHSIRLVMIAVILRSIFSFGIEATLIFVGIGNFLSTGIHLISIMGNRGTFTKSVFQIVTDTEIIYHVTLLMFCVLGLCLAPAVLLSLAAARRVLGGDAEKCDSISHSERPVNHTDCTAGRHPDLSVLHFGLSFLQE